MDNLFEQLDCSFEGCEFAIPGNDGSYRLTKIEETESGNPVSVTIHPKNLFRAHVSRQTFTYSMDFTQDHPLLYDEDSHPSIFCNSSLPMGEWENIKKSVLSRMSENWGEEDVRGIHENVVLFGSKGSFLLGKFADPVFIILREILDEKGLDTVRSNHNPPMPRVLCVIGDDYLIADDFDIEVSEIPRVFKGLLWK